MKKLKLATIISVIGISLIGCGNSQVLNNKPVTIEEAKEIALKHAGLKNNEVSFVEAEKDIDNGVEKYNIEFYHGNKEYDYEINSANGEIIKYDHDIEFNNNQNNNQNNNINSNTNNTQNNNQNNVANISEEQAKEIALKHAGLTSDQVSFVQVTRDMDNGIEKYDVEFFSGNKEYDYEINSANGQIMQYDYDIEYNNQINGQSNTPNNAVSISQEQAKEIALKHAGLASNQVALKRVELDFDNGIQKYEVEFYYNNREYSYEIDANSGNILSYEQD